MKRMTTEKFVEEIQKEFPNIKLRAHRELLRTAFFSPFKCKETGAVRYGAEEIARAFGVVPSSSFKAGEKLKEFLALLPEGSAKLLLVNGKEWVKGIFENDGPTEVLNEETGMSEVKSGTRRVGTGLQRRVLFTWSDKVQKLLDAELNNTSTEKVYFVTGNKRNESYERGLLKDKIELATNEIEMLDTEIAKEIGNYMNTAPINSFNQITTNAQEALHIINSLPTHVRDSQIRILNAILESPKPVYRPSKNGNTDRLFGCGANITNLKSEVRQALTQWDEVDIKSCQLAIVAYLWGVEEVTDFLKTGKSFWTEILSFLGLTIGAKGILKDFTYGLIYGMSKDNIVNGINKLLPGVGNHFITHPLVKALLAARTNIYKQAVKGGLMIDAVGNKHEVTKENVLTVMSRVAQSYEQLLLHSIYEVAQTTNEFSISLYMYDGVSIKWHNSSRKEFWINEINEYFNTRAEELGIVVSLEWKFVETIEFITEMVESTEAVNGRENNSTSSNISTNCTLLDTYSTSIDPFEDFHREELC